MCASWNAELIFVGNCYALPITCVTHVHTNCLAPETFVQLQCGKFVVFGNARGGT
jgi:hypothetical protein